MNTAALLGLLGVWSLVGIVAFLNRSKLKDRLESASPRVRAGMAVGLLVLLVVSYFIANASGGAAKPSNACCTTSTNASDKPLPCAFDAMCNTQGGTCGSTATCDSLVFTSSPSSSFNNTWVMQANDDNAVLSKLVITDSTKFRAVGKCGADVDCDFGDVVTYMPRTDTSVIVQWENGVVATLTVKTDTDGSLKLHVSDVSVGTNTYLTGGTTQVMNPTVT